WASSSWVLLRTSSLISAREKPKAVPIK
ncbi:hypothetical protein ID866_7679, partial [Astraeus odoratus]